MKEIVYATTNPGKFAEVAKLFAGHHIQIHSPSEYGATIAVDETGTTLEENATLKAEAYRDAIKDEVVVLGDDTGVEIVALGGEPGIRVRRWKGYEMQDEEIIAYCLERLAGIPIGKRDAQFRTVIAVAIRGLPTKTFDGILPGTIVEKAIPLRMVGFPFESIFYSTEYNMMLGAIHQLSIEEKLAKNILTHRERAVTAALPYLATLTN